MQTHLNILQASRLNILAFFEDMTHDELLTIPAGFRNHIFWNAAHIVVTQQLLHYKLSGLAMHLSDEIVEQYRKGSVPSTEVNTAEIEQIRLALSSSPQQLEQDLETGIFQSFQPYETSYGLKLNSFEEALAFNNVHEGLHLGYMMALRKAIAHG